MIPTVTSSEIVHKNPWWQVRHDSLTLSNGNTGNYYVVELRPAALIIAENEKGQLLVVSQYRHPVGRTLIQFPMGLAEAGETALDAAQRELKEETGCIAREWKTLGWLDRAPGIAQGKLDVFLARGVHNSEQTALDATELDLNHRWMTRDEWNRALQQNEITCSNTLSAWALYVSK